MTRTEIAALACRLLALAMFAFVGATTIPVLVEAIQLPMYLWRTVFGGVGLAVFGVAAVWTLFAVYYWQRAGKLALRMVDNDPQPIRAVNFSADDVLVAGCRAVGIVLSVGALRSGIDVAAIGLGPGAAAVTFHLPTSALRALFDAVIGLGLLYGTKGIVDLLRSIRHVGPELRSPPSDGRGSKARRSEQVPPSGGTENAPSDTAGDSTMIGLEFAALAIRIGSLVLLATLGVFAAGAALWILFLIYGVLARGRVDDSFVMLISVFIPALAAWLLAKHFRRSAEELATPPHFDADQWTDAPQGGRELLTAALVWFGGYLLLVGARGLAGAWFAYDLYQGSLERRGGSLFGEFPVDEFARAEMLRQFVGTGADVVTGLVLVFAGRRISQLLYGRDSR